jgi:hypothetical protein
MSATDSRREFESSTKGVWALGGIAFAGVMLITVSVFQVFEAIAALAKDDVFVRGVDYAYAIDLTTWGWIHLVLGLVGVATGIGLLANQTWAYLVGIVIAFFGMLSSFAFLPYYPFWAMTIIAFDVFVIWALTVTMKHDRP